MVENGSPSVSGKNDYDIPENKIEIQKLSGRRVNETICVITDDLHLKVIVKVSPDTGTPSTIPQPRMSGFGALENTAIGSDSMLYGDVDVTRDIDNNWHVCSDPECGTRNIISEFDFRDPPICQNIEYPHLFKPSQITNKKVVTIIVRGITDNADRKAE